MSTNDSARRAAIESFYRVKGAVFMGGLPGYNTIPPYARAEIDAIAAIIREEAAKDAVDVEIVAVIQHLVGWIETMTSGVPLRQYEREELADVLNRAKKLIANHGRNISKSDLAPQVDVEQKWYGFTVPMLDRMKSDLAAALKGEKDE